MGKTQALYVEGDEEYKRLVKVAAAERGMTVARFVREALDAFFVAQGDRRIKRPVRKSSAPIRYTSLKD